MLSVTVCTVGYVCFLLCRVQVFKDFVGLLSMIIYEVSYIFIIMMFKINTVKKQVIHL